jgi:hypothetical protein
MRSIKSYIVIIFLTALLSLFSKFAYAQLFQEISQTVRITVTVVEGIAVGPCSFDPYQICTNEDEYGLGTFGIRIIGIDERPTISRALASIASPADLKMPIFPIREQPTAHVWDKRL